MRLTLNAFEVGLDGFTLVFEDGELQTIEWDTTPICGIRDVIWEWASDHAGELIEIERELEGGSEADAAYMSGRDK